MKKLAISILPVLAFLAVSACGKQESTPSTAGPAAPAPAPATEPSAKPAPAPETPVAAGSDESTQAAPTETITETEDAPESAAQSSTGVQPSLRLGGSPAGLPTSERFKEGVNYRRLVPAQPTSVAPDKVEVVEVFWYGCNHCFALDPAIEAWRGKNRPQYVEFVRIPAMWNDTTRMHARLFYAAQLLGRLEALHAPIFREIHVNGNQLNTLDKLTAFFKQHGVSAQEFNQAFSSFAVESKLQRADFLNKRYRVQSVPMFVVNGKYAADPGEAGGVPELFALIDELAAHEHGG